ncbi:MAG: subclass B3 metallo-beta-lactamase [Chitinophagaceae bacterium]|nr:subclass B3 metallo-beta-lactamase [Chitinophagaceae bacterium]MCW5927368.1 subclass B3 metallo-beta-lactamase [Chitinophagaceae bacterium]
MKITISFLMILFTGVLFPAMAQKVNEPKNNPADWSKPYEPFRIVGNLYYVGTYDLAAYLVVTGKGNILINTGLADSKQLIKNSIEKLGFKYTDTRILLTTQAHYDHLGAMAAIKKETGAEFWVNQKDAPEAKSGGATDYELGYLGVSFAPVKPDKLLQDKDIIQLGDTKLTMLHHPGHTKGSSSYLLEVTDESGTFKVLIANIPTIITSRKFSEVSEYPEIKQDLSYTLTAMQELNFDLWVASHASQFGLHKKRQPGEPYNPRIFADRKGYDLALENVKKIFRER